LERLADKRAEKTAQNSQAAEAQTNNRGDQMNELIREASASELEVYKFNDMNDYDIDVSPGFVWEELQMFNIDLFEEKLQMEANVEKKYFTIQMNDPETDKIDFKIKVKFFALE